ncbi:MAG: VWA domain-containing protein, partial [Chlorobi bacterium]|nr:VWA domain-containing protein [Chlorobiota bacterium]
MNELLRLRNCRWIASMTVLILACAFTSAPGQELQLNVSSVDTSQFPDISMTVRVTNRNGPLININESNFTVLENGVIQSPIKLVCTADSSSPALSLALVMDVSYSMIFYPGRNDVDPDSTKLVYARRAFADFVLNMRQVDEAAFMTFARDFLVDQTFTADKKTLMDVIVNARPRPGTAIYDAVYEAVNRLRNRPNKKVIVILTDGNDFLSTWNEYEAIAAAQKAGIPVFTIGLGSDVDSTKLSLIASQTGGKFIFAPEAKDLKALYQSIAKYIYRGLCTLSYRSSEDCPDGTLRVVEVLVNMDTQSDKALFSYQAPVRRETVQFFIQAKDTINDNQLLRIPIIIQGHLTPGDTTNGSILCTFNFNHMTYVGYEVSGGIFDSAGVSVTEESSGNIGIRFQGAVPSAFAGTVVTLLFRVPDRDTETHTLFMLQPGSFRQHCDYDALGDRKEVALTGCPDEVMLALSEKIILPSNSKAMIPVML